jgi:hypothetical protein
LWLPASSTSNQPEGSDLPNSPVLLVKMMICPNMEILICSNIEFLKIIMNKHLNNVYFYQKAAWYKIEYDRIPAFSAAVHGNS